MWASVNDQLVEMAAFFRAMIGSFARFCWAQKWGILVFVILGMGGWLLEVLSARGNLHGENDIELCSPRKEDLRRYAA